MKFFVVFGLFMLVAHGSSAPFFGVLKAGRYAAVGARSLMRGGSNKLGPAGRMRDLHDQFSMYRRLNPKARKAMDVGLALGGTAAMGVLGAVIENAVREQLIAQGSLNETIINATVANTQKAISERLKLEEQKEDYTLFDLLANYVGNETGIPRTAKLVSENYIPNYDDTPEVPAEPETSNYIEQTTKGTATSANNRKRLQLVSAKELFRILKEHKEKERLITLVAVLTVTVIFSVVCCLLIFCLKRKQSLQQVAYDHYRSFHNERRHDGRFDNFQNQNLSNQNVRQFEEIGLH